MRKKTGGSRICRCSSLAGVFGLLLLLTFPFSLCADITVSLTAYNLENLWDAVDDPDQGDPAFIPMALKEKWTEDKCAPVRLIPTYFKLCTELDWTQDKYDSKLKKVANVITQTNHGKGPDILVIEEVENRRVVIDLLNELKPRTPLRFYTHFESPGRRGIDVAILSRFKPIRRDRHPVQFQVKQEDEMVAETISTSRDIAEAEFEIRGVTFIVAANHWPSQAAPTEARLAAANVLLKLALNAKERKVPFLATGDFNTKPSEEPNPIADVLAGESSSKPLIDLIPDAREDSFPPASHFYRGKWEPLDRILVSKDILSGDYGVVASPDQFWIADEEFLFEEDTETGIRRPHRYDFFSGEGYADHLPVGIHFRVKTFRRK